MTMQEDRPSLSIEALLAHAVALRRLAVGLLRDHHAADDVVQETWAAALLSPPRAGVPLGAWLRTIARNFALRSRRSSARRRKRERGAARPEAEPAAWETLQRVETQRRVAAAVLELEEPFRSAILLRYFEGLSHAEISARTGVPAATVRTRVKRGLDRLRARIDARCGGDGKAWRLALAPLAALPSESALALGVVAVGTKTKLALATAVVIASLLAFRGFVGEDGDSARGEARRTDTLHVETPDPVEGEASPPAARRESLTLRGRVLYPWGRGAKGAEVVLLPAAQRDPRWSRLPMAKIPERAPAALGSTVAGEDGHFDLDADAPVGAQVFVGARAEGYAWRILTDVDVRRRSSGLVIRLVPTSRLLPGVVVDSNGQPVPGARIRPMFDFVELPGEGLRSGGDGTFEIPAGHVETGGRPRGAWRQLLVRHPGYLPALGYASIERREVRIVLHRGEPVEGLVVDADGKAVPDALVYLTGTWFEQETRTDGAGRFRFERAASTGFGRRGWRPTFGISVDAGARGQVVHPKLPWTLGTFLRVELSPALRRVARVIDIDGRGIAGVRVTVHQTRDHLRQTVVSDAEGRLALEPATTSYTSCVFEHAEYALAPASATGQPPWAVHSFLENNSGEPGPEREFLLWRKAVVRGRVVDTHGKPVPGALVWPGRKTGWRDARGPGFREHLLTDAEGRFEFRLGNWAYDLVLRARTHEHAVTLSEPFRAEPSGEREIEIRFSEPMRIEGSVHDTTGAPIALAQVVVGDTTQTTFTAPDGSFHLVGVPSGVVQLSVEKAGFLGNRGPHDVSAGRRRIVLDRSLLFRGRLLDEHGVAIPNLDVSRGFSRGGWLDGEGHSRTDGKGFFFFRGCAPGEYSLIVRRHTVVPAKFAVPRDGVVEFRATRTVVRPLAISGRVRDEMGQPLPLGESASVTALDGDGKSRGRGQCDLEGRFAIRGLPEGRYALKTRSATRVFEPLADVAAGVSGIEIGATPPVVISGRVLDAFGIPLRWVVVTVVAESSPGFEGLPPRRPLRNSWDGPTGSTDAGGRFRIEGAFAGSSTVVLLHSRHEVKWRNGVAKGAQDLEFRLREGRRLAGFVALPESIDLEKAEVRLRVEDRLGILRTSRADATGAFLVRGLADGTCRIHAYAYRPFPLLARDDEVEAGSEDLRLVLGKVPAEELRKLTSRRFQR